MNTDMNNMTQTDVPSHEALMKQIKRSLDETAIKDYNQLKVRNGEVLHAKITLQSMLRDFGGTLIYCTDANM